MRKRNLASAVATALGVVSTMAFTSALAVPVTFVGEDLNGPPRQDPSELAATPNADAARANFLSNLVGVGTEDFETQSGAPPITLVFPGAGQATLTGGVGIETSNDGAGRYAISGTNYYYAGSGNFNIAFNAPIAAFGFYGVDIGDYGADLTLVLTDTGGVTSVLSVPLTLGTNGDLSGSVIYFGFYDTATQYTAIAFQNSSGGGDNFGFDDMTIGSLEQVKPVPEPASLALVGLGLAGMGAIRRRKA